MEVIEHLVITYNKSAKLDFRYFNLVAQTRPDSVWLDSVLTRLYYSKN